jgi:lipid-binding SYLF domain-containing protein
MKSFAFAAAAVLAAATAVHAAIGSDDVQRLAKASQVVRHIRSDIPDRYWSRARCVVIVPDLKKAAFLIGSDYGKGVMSCRSANEWSAPLFMQLAKGSWGLQLGAEQVDVVLLVMNEGGAQKLLENKINLGVDASLSAGPVGRQAQAGTDGYSKAEILSYSRAQGVFAGINLSGGVLRPDKDVNRNAYGSGVTPRTILASRQISAPTEATPFLNALGTPGGPGDEGASRSSVAGTIRKASSGPASSTPLATVDSDLVTRVVDMQQTLNRLLSSEAQVPVGTSGSSTSTTVAVDRAELMRLRQQLDALLVAIDRQR